MSSIQYDDDDMPNHLTMYKPSKVWEIWHNRNPHKNSRLSFEERRRRKLEQQKIRKQKMNARNKIIRENKKSFDKWLKEHSGGLSPDFSKANAAECQYRRNALKRLARNNHKNKIIRENRESFDAWFVAHGGDLSL